MKTERRHELHENELANWLADQIAKIQPYSKVIVGVGVLLAAAFFATSYLGSRQATSQQAAWAAYYDATSTGDPEDFRQVAENYPGTNASGWALESAADLLLNQGVGNLFRDRDEAKKQLDAAREAYEAVIGSFTDPMLLERATFGLGKTYEAMGDLAKAQAQYETVTKTWDKSEFAVLAGERLAQLQKSNTKEWYDWFVAQKPVVSPVSDPSLFQDLPNLPDKPDLQMPRPGELLGPSSDDSELSDATAPTTDGAELPDAALPDAVLPEGVEPALPDAVLPEGVEPALPEAVLPGGADESTPSAAPPSTSLDVTPPGDDN